MPRNLHIQSNHLQVYTRSHLCHDSRNNPQCAWAYSDSVQLYGWTDTLNALKLFLLEVVKTNQDTIAGPADLATQLKRCRKLLLFTGIRGPNLYYNWDEVAAVLTHLPSLTVPESQSASINLCRHWPVGDLWPSRITISPWAEKVVH